MLKLFLLCLTCIHTIQSCSAEKLIIDTDAGADDALAILMLLRAEQLQPDKYQIVGITCSYGNTKEEAVERNVLKTLTVANRSDIPVYRGAKKPLLRKFATDNIFGRDGFGEIDFDRPIIAEVDESMPAAIALIELTKKYQGNINIITLGPTTNVAHAASLDEDFVGRVNKFRVMGSSVAGMSFYKPNVEFNFGADPEGNFILLSSTDSSQLTLFPWEASFNANLSKNWRINVLGQMDSPYIEFINAIEMKTLLKVEDYNPPDVMSVATMLWPQIIERSFETYVEPVVDGAARGSVLVEYNRDKSKAKRNPNARIIWSINVELFMEAMIYYLTCERVPC